MKRRVLTAVILMGGCMVAAGAFAAEMGEGAPNAEALGWRLGCQAYSFNRFTFFEAVDKVNQLGLKYIEMYGGQSLSPDDMDTKTGPDMSAEARQKVREKLAASGVTLTNYGVTGLSDDEAECRKVFEFAKDMGIETICSEPNPKAFDLIDKLCQEYKISVALHNHPKPSMYWNPDKVLAACEGRSKYIGACADTGHWCRSGIDPLEAVKKLEGRIVSFHFKDLNEFGNKDAHDVPWGTGIGQTGAILEELKRQEFKGVFSIEYEHNWDNSVPEIAECVAYFNKEAGKLSK